MNLHGISAFTVLKSVCLKKLTVIYHKFEFKAKLLSGFSAKNHTVHEYFKILHDTAYTRIYSQYELDHRFGIVNDKLGFCNGIIYAVMNIKICRFSVAHTVAAYI